MDLSTFTRTPELWDERITQIALQYLYALLVARDTAMFTPEELSKYKLAEYEGITKFLSLGKALVLSFPPTHHHTLHTTGKDLIRFFYTRSFSPQVSLPFLF